MDYIAVSWLHSFPDEPVLLYSELDDQRWEVRTIDVFRDGSMYFADGSRHSGSTELGEAPVPTIEEIAEDPQFLPRAITRQEFEELWAKAINPA